MGYFIGSNGYYEGDKQLSEDEEVTQRPDSNYELVNGSWVLSTSKQAIAEIKDIENSNPITHRALREFVLAVASQFPQAATLHGVIEVSTVDAQIVALRTQL